MGNVNERPVCHRAEDLVTYLYGEANEADARDFASHMQQCDACKSEFAVFNQVHESILLWRNEALGASFSPAARAADASVQSTQFVSHERKLSALAALREFFSVSPLWLRGATAFAALLLCVLAVLVVSRSGNKPEQIARGSAEPKVYTEADLKNELAKQADLLKRSQSAPQDSAREPQVKPSITQDSPRRELARSTAPPRSQRVRGLTRQEREQLAADLRLVPGREEELPFVFSDEPNQ